MEPKKILVVDDSRLIHKMFRVLFGNAELVGASDGREALDRLAENPDVDLIILDINMPQMNGLEVLDHLRDDAALSAVPVVIVSTEGKEEDTIRGLEAGAKGYVKKPFDGNDVLHLIARL